jgi:hypothetical protein
MKKINRETEKLIRAQMAYEKAAADVITKMTAIAPTDRRPEILAFTKSVTSNRDALCRIVSAASQIEAITQSRIAKLVKRAQALTLKLGAQMRPPEEKPEQPVAPVKEILDAIRRAVGPNVEIVPITKEEALKLAREGGCGNPDCPSCGNGKRDVSAATTVH